MKWDWTIIMIGILLLLAIIITLTLGKDHGRHGYGSVFPSRPHTEEPNIT